MNVYLCKCICHNCILLFRYSGCIPNGMQGWKLYNRSTERCIPNGMQYVQNPDRGVSLLPIVTFPTECGMYKIPIGVIASTDRYIPNEMRYVQNPYRLSLGSKCHIIRLCILLWMPPANSITRYAKAVINYHRLLCF